MKSLFVDRKTFWIFVAVFVAFKIGLVIAIEYAPATLSILKHVETGMVCALAFVVGARFADIGWRRWLGIVLTFLFAAIVPILLFFLFVVLSNPPKTKNPLDLIPDNAWIATLLLVVLLIVAGSKKSRPREERWEDEKLALQRKEPPPLV
jgi:hypothetical protein